VKLVLRRSRTVVAISTYRTLVVRSSCRGDKSLIFLFLLEVRAAAVVFLRVAPRLSARPDNRTRPRIDDGVLRHDTERRTRPSPLRRRPWKRCAGASRSPSLLLRGFVCTINLLEASSCVRVYHQQPLSYFFTDYLDSIPSGSFQTTTRRPCRICWIHRPRAA